MAHPAEPLKPAINIDYDNLQIASHKSITELTDDGIMIWTSPGRYIRANKDGVDIKGGIIETETLRAESLEVYGDVSVFGDFEASAISPDNDNPGTVVSTTGGSGTSTAYSRGDHTHQLQFTTINDVLSGQNLTNDINLTGNITASGNISASGTINANSLSIVGSKVIFIISEPY